MSTTKTRPSRAQGSAPRHQNGSHGGSGRTNLRVPPAVKKLLVRAAQVKATTLTDFMLRAAVASAEEVLAERTRFVLSPESWAKFNAALDAPARDVPALRKLLSERSVFDAE